MHRIRSAQASLTGTPSALANNVFVTICSVEGHEPAYSFEVQCSLLVIASPWFAKALDGRFLEGQRRRLHFPETHVDVVKAFLYWLFSGNLEVDEFIGKDKVNPSARVNLIICCRLWAFGDGHFLPILQNDVIRVMNKWVTHDWPSCETIREAYLVSSPGAALRRLILHELVYGYTSQLVPGEGCNGYTTAEVESLNPCPGLFADLLRR